MGFESVACALCGGDRARALFEIAESNDERLPPAWRGGAAIPVVRCESCGLVYLNPRYDGTRLEALYQDPAMFKASTDPEGRTRSIAAERPQRVARFKLEAEELGRVKARGRLLDVGCGLGFFLEALGGRYDAVGLEWSRPAVDELRSAGLNIVAGRFPQHPFPPASFDVVSFHNVLDHLPDPLAALRAARELLAPGGVLLLTLTNFASPCARIYGPGFRLLGANHLYYFTPRTLSAALAKSDFARPRFEYPYFGTEFARPLPQAWQLLRDACALHLLRRPGKRLSPPFYGNVMRVFAAKKA